MADNELKLTVTTDAGVTINELEKQIKSLRSEFKASAIGSKEFNAAAQELKKTLEQKTQAMRVAETENAKLMRSYFTLGEELRRKTNPAFISFNQVIQDAPYGIRGVGNNIEFLTQQFTQLRSQGLTTGQILKGMIGNIFTPMGGLMFAVSAGTSLLTVAMDKLGSSSDATSPKLEEVRKKLDEIARLQYDLGQTNASKYWDYLDDRLHSIAKIKPESSFLKDLATIAKNTFNLTGIPKAVEGYSKLFEIIRQRFSNVVAQGSFNEDDLLDAIKQELEAKKKISDLEKEATKEKKKQADESMRQFEALLKFRVAQRDFESKTFVTANGTRAYDYIKSKPFNVNAPLEGVNVPKVSPFDIDESMQKDTEKNLRQMMDIYRSVFFDPIRASFDAVANGSKSMADAFVQSIKRMIAQLLELAAASAILSIFGLGNFSTNFKLLSGISSLSQKVSLDNGGTGSTQELANLPTMNKGSNRVVVEIAGKISGRDINIVNSREQAFQNAVKI